MMAAARTASFAAPGVSPGARSGSDLICLHAAFGQDEASHGAERYVVNDNGLIWVPCDAVAALTTVGGFVVATRE